MFSFVFEANIGSSNPLGHSYPFLWQLIAWPNKNRGLDCYSSVVKKESSLPAVVEDLIQQVVMSKFYRRETFRFWRIRAGR